MHRHPAALDRLLAAARDGATTHVRGQALFWLAQRAGEQAVGAISDAIANDPETEVKRRAVFALSQLPEERRRAAADSGRAHEYKPGRSQAGDVLARTVARPARAAVLSGNPLQVAAGRPAALLAQVLHSLTREAEAKRLRRGWR